MKEESIPPPCPHTLVSLVCDQHLGVSCYQRPNLTFTLLLLFSGYNILGNGKVVATPKAESQSELFKANFECLYPNRKPAITMRIFIEEAYIWKSNVPFKLCSSSL